MTQLDLNMEKQTRLDKLFESYDFHNPKIYLLFKKYAREIKQAGRLYYGAKSIMERIRWHVTIETSGEFKINNNFTSRYVRKLIQEDQSFVDFFSLRELRS